MGYPTGLCHRVVVMVTLLNCLGECTWNTPWSLWWSYEGISGPEYWGVLNLEWSMCKKGRQQSPIDIEPSRLLFDPNLKHLKMEFAMVKGLLVNTGHDISLFLQEDGYNHVNVSLGPLSYNFRLAQVKFHFGNSDVIGSEHTIDGKSFPVEMHMLTYNTDLYSNFSDAIRGVKGIAVIAVFMEIGKEPNKAFTIIGKELTRLRSKGGQAMVYNLKVDLLVPDTEQYMTYEGSLTQPGCQETVTWILFNKPVYLSADQLSQLRVLYGGRENLDIPLETNARPQQALNHRVVRTNINHRKRTRLCTMERKMHYQINDIYDKKEPEMTQKVVHGINGRREPEMTQRVFHNVFDIKETEGARRASYDIYDKKKTEGAQRASYDIYDKKETEGARRASYDIYDKKKTEGAQRASYDIYDKKETEGAQRASYDIYDKKGTEGAQRASYDIYDKKETEGAQGDGH